MNDKQPPKSICILGRQPEIGLAELESLYGPEHVSRVSTGVAGLDLPVDQIDFDRLGGSTRLAEVLAEVPSKLWKDAEKQLAKEVVELAGQLPEGKVQLGLSTIGIPITPAKLNASGLTLKKILRGKTGRSVRLTPNPELELNSASVLHNHLTGPTGIELLIIALEGGKTLIARTTAVQDIDGYAHRDQQRPKRDARIGMLPPKLAQIIINLAIGRLPTELIKLTPLVAKDSTPSLPNQVLDPFCGTGVILQEAALMGYEVYGYDLDQRMIDYATTNLEWLSNHYGAHYGGKIDIHFNLSAGDATNTTYESTFLTTNTVIASETYLGRPFTDRPSGEILAQTASEVNLILKKFLRNIHKQLQPGTHLCLAIPAWQISPGQFKHLPLIDSLEDMGYNQTRFEHVQNHDLLYYREDQIVARELLVITRK
ncbi:MAG: hypothetical protein ABI220_00360 [Candidatus Saccharimonadales bacterium]